MTEEEKIAKDKEAVARMIGAKSAMEAAQRRIVTLEQALGTALDQGNTLLTYVPETAYPYRGETNIRRMYADSFAKLRTVL